MRESTERDYRERVMRVLVHLERHLDDDLSLDDLAAIACFSPFHFHRVFRAVVGEPLREHLRRLRLERAARQLATTRRAVGRIALDAGYDTPESFARAFREHFDVAPSRYRRSKMPDAGEGAAAPIARAGTLVRGREDTMPARVVFRQVEPTPVIFIRHTGPYAEVSQVWERLFAWAGRRGLLVGAARLIGIPHDDPHATATDHVRYDACLAPGVAAARELGPDGEVGVREVDGGQYAVALHEGPYDTLDATYEWLFGEWLPASGRELADRPAFELYLNSPLDTPGEQLRTEIHLPL